MRVLMINSNRFKQPWPVIPFGLCCVAAAAEKAGHQVEVLDLCFSRNCAKAIAIAVERYRPELVALSVRNIDNSAGYNTLFLLENVKEEVVAPLKKSFAGPIVIGGPSVGISGAEMLQYLDLPLAVRGDGEYAITELVDRLEKGLPLDGLKGVVRHENGRIIEDNSPFLVGNLNDLPIVKPQRYINLAPYRRFDSPLQIQTKRGCPLSCSYCTYNRIEGLRFRLYDPERIADQIELLVKETGINHVEFTDSTFNLPLDHAKEVLRAVAAKNLNLKLRTMGLNPGAVDEDLVGLMRQVGFRDVDLGAEAGCDVMLEALGKNFKTSDILEAGRLLQKHKIPTTWYLLVGAPGETEQTLAETFETINTTASPWDLVNVGVGIRVYNGSPLAEKMRRENPDCTQDNFLQPVNFVPEKISLNQVKVITKRMALNHPNYFMYDEDETTPAVILMLGTALLRIFAPRQPLWRMHILIRRIQGYLGIIWLKKKIFELQLKKAKEVHD